MNRIENLLLCVGAQKAGTTWLAKMLAKHQDIEFSKYKEIHYFDGVEGMNRQLANRILNNISEIACFHKSKMVDLWFDGKEKSVEKVNSLIDDEWYVNQFSKGKKYSADFTPEYALLKDETIKSIKKISKNQKIIFIMREPVSRTLSAVQYFHQNRGVDLSKMKENELKRKVLRDVFISRSKYEYTLSVLSENFDESDMLIVFYEEMMRDKSKALDRFSQFLDIENLKFDNDAVNKKINSSEKFDFPNSVLDVLRKELEPTIIEVEKYMGYLPTEWRA